MTVRASVLVHAIAFRTDPPTESAMSFHAAACVGSGRPSDETKFLEVFLVGQLPLHRRPRPLSNREGRS